MIEGFGAALSALSAQQQRMDALANDTANVNTAGYRSDRVGFTDLMQGSATTPGASGGVAATSLGPSTAQGALIDTGNPLDLAIEGDGFFQVAGPSGQPALTRQGAFHVNATGEVVTDSGAPLVPPVRLPAGSDGSAIHISSDGTVTVAGVRAARIQLVTVAAPGALQPAGDGTYAPTPASGPPAPAAATTSAVRQGALESSDVDLADTSLGTLQARTSYAAAVRVLHVQDEMLGALLDIRGER
jgi:flagellar basal-body rod protein FlgG